MRLLIGRHGQTEWNLARRLQGLRDSPLTAVGREQARALGKAWRQEGVIHVVSSTLPRARDTAQLAAAELACSWGDHPDLAEQHYGEIEGMHIPQVNAAYPQLAGVFDGSDVDSSPPGGESIRACGERVLRGLLALPHRAGATVGVITHGHALQGLLWLLSGEPRQGSGHFRHVNASYSELRVGHNQHIDVVRCMVAEHLMPVGMDS